ncbi:MAG TPA: FG-GAP-like repeat-containing protein [Polyangiaceae bacterium]
MAFDRVQPPELAVGQRATLAGSLASTAYSPSDVSRGGFTLPSPFSTPKDRGEVLAQIFPSYSPDNGLSAWGMGFAANLELTRFRVSGSLQYDFAKGDELIGPFGHLVKGNDGNFYPLGLDKPVRVVPGDNDTFLAYHPDGSVWTFGGAARETTNNGTFAWHLTQVKDVTGHVTTLTWSKNPSGKLFLAAVEYGGRATSQYRVSLDYEPVNYTDPFGVVHPKFVDYRSGAPLALDQRVTKVTVLARNEATGNLAERWHYDLGYQEETVGAAFYLAQITQTFASGEAAPPIRYAYNLKGAALASTQMKEIPELTQLFSTLGVGAGAIQPNQSAVVDADGDGNSDLELDDSSRTLISQKGSGTADDPLHFDSAPLPPSSTPFCSDDGQTGCIYRGCLPYVDDGTIAPPRLLSQLNPTDTTVHVMSFSYDPDADQTAISVCGRDGTRIAQQSVPRQWDQSSATRFVDLNGDHMADLVRVYFGGYTVLPNVSQVAGKDAQFAWGSEISGELDDAQGNPLTPSSVWVSDLSGDGIPDLVGLNGDAIEVWHGLGNFQFTTNAQELRFFDRQGNPFGGLVNFSLIPADLNKDGLQDYFITNNTDVSDSRFIKYFTNVGGSYVETPVAALDGLPFSASPPVIATLDGTGNMSVTVTDGGKAYAVALDGPESGLMASADDGRGTVLTFQYARGPASPGIRHRSVLLASMEVQSSGYDVMDYDYRYENPTVHTIGRFLVGYDRVTRREGDLPAAPLGSNVMSFLNSDAFSGLLVNGRQTDLRLPDVAKIEERTYTDETFQGIAYKRLKTSTSGWASADGSARSVDVTSFDAYQNDFCPKQTTVLTATHGKLATSTTRANPANLVNNLHCLEAEVVEAGTHADSSLDFKRDQVIARNAAGRITQVSTAGGAGPLVQQQIAYDGDLDPLAITIPGKGVTAIVYDPATKLPRQITAPDGVVTQMAVRDPITDAPMDVRTSRGGLTWNAYARYDGLERLASRWSDLDGSSADAPHEHYTYTYAATNHPGTVGVHTLVDAATGVYKTTTELYTAADEKIGTAELGDAGWVVDGFIARSRAHDEEDHFEVMTQPAATPWESIDFTTLLQGQAGGAPDRISTLTKTTLGTPVATSERLHVDVTKATTTSLQVNAAGQMVRTTLVNGINAATTLLDPGGKLEVGYIDEAQTRYGFAYDALGRFRAVQLPDGSHHTVAYDEYGRESLIVRDGVARITTTYAPATGGTSDLVATRTFASSPADGSASVPQRSTAWTYDGAGRKRTETHTDLTSIATKTYTFLYDGATPASPSASGALGLLTGVQGDGYTKSTVYRPDGKPLHRELVLTGFRTIATDVVYREDGSVKDQTVIVKDPSGNVVQTSAHHQEVDSFGRPSSATVNGSLLAAIDYDALGRANKATFGTGDAVTFAYDALTRATLGYDQMRAKDLWTGVASTRIKRNDRGFIGQEILGVGAGQVQRTYTYSPQGFLSKSVDGAPQ